MVVLVWTTLQHEQPKRLEEADFADVDPEGRLWVRKGDGTVLASIEEGDWLRAQVNDGPVFQPPQAF
jgi:hypothetical protein